MSITTFSMAILQQASQSVALANTALQLQYGGLYWKGSPRDLPQALVLALAIFRNCAPQYLDFIVTMDPEMVSFHLIKYLYLHV